MKLLRKLWATVARHDARSLDSELRFHIEMRARDLEQSGRSPDEALREAKVRFGNVTLQTERTREATTMVWLESIFHDLRYALRMMRRTPLVTAIAVLSLALGIGANTAIFTVLDAILLRSLPVKDARRVVVLSWVSPADVSMKLMRNLSTYTSSEPNTVSSPSFSYPLYEQLRQHASTTAGLFAFADIQAGVTANGQAEIALGQVVSGSYYDTLGVAPVAGRAFTVEDDRESASPVCLISYRYWQRRFALNPAIVGQEIAINSVPFTLIGVEPEGFLGMSTGNAPDVTIPIRHSEKFRTNGGESPYLDAANWWVQIGARLKPGIDPQQARTELTLLFQQSALSETVRKGDRPPVVTFSQGGQGLNFAAGTYRNPLLVLMSVVGVVLLIACANVANLLLARAKVREKETAMRLALGAGRGRIARQLLTESILLATMASALGIGIAYWASDLLATFNGLVIDVRPDARVLGFTAAIALITGVLFGLAPALRTANADLQPHLQRTAATSVFSLSRLLVIGQFALSLVVLVGAGLYLRTLHNLRSVDLGLNPRHLLVFRLMPSLAGYSNARATDFNQRVLASLEHISGVEFAAISRHIPLSGSSRSTRVLAPGSSVPPERLRQVFVNLASPHFLETMGMPLLLGRNVEERDNAGAPLVALVNEAFVKVFSPGESPLGRHFQSNTMTDGIRVRDYEIVGVVRDSKYNAIRRAAPPTVFLSYLQSPNDGGNMAFEVRTADDPVAVAGAVRHAIAELDSNVPVYELSTEEEKIDRLIRQDRLFAGLSAVFGALALLLAAIGLYGVRAYAVARRTSEIGIRMALGANRAEIKRMILRETGWLALFGVAIGLASAYGLTRYVESMLYGVAPRDLTTFAGAAVVLVAVAATAGYLPARRASNVDPMIALRHD
jgi:predicted permease